MSVNQFQVMRALKIPRFFRIINSGLKPFEDFQPCLLIDLRPQRVEEAPGGQWHLKSIGMKSGEWPSRDHSGFKHCTNSLTEEKCSEKIRVMCLNISLTKAGSKPFRVPGM